MGGFNPEGAAGIAGGEGMGGSEFFAFFSRKIFLFWRGPERQSAVIRTKIYVNCRLIVILHNIVKYHYNIGYFL